MSVSENNPLETLGVRWIHWKKLLYLWHAYHWITQKIQLVFKTPCYCRLKTLISSLHYFFTKILFILFGWAWVNYKRITPPISTIMVEYMISIHITQGWSLLSRQLHRQSGKTYESLYIIWVSKIWTVCWINQHNVYPGKYEFDIINFLYLLKHILKPVKKS